MSEVKRIRNELFEIVMKSIINAKRLGHLSDDEYNDLLKEAQDMMKDSDEEIRALGSELVEVRERGLQG